MQLPLILSTLPAILCMDAITKDLLTPAANLGEACGYDSCKEIRENTLNVHIVPHTHGELGFTADFYVHYTGNFNPDQPKSHVNMKRILDYTITELWADTDRKFTLSDVAYFFYWWSQRDGTVRRMVYELIRQGRLHIVGGGFSMPDEATTNYHAVIDMLTYSLRKLNGTFLDCARPLVSWQADVFGHSREFASLMAQMGFDGHFINPISYDDEVGRMVTKSLEFIWRGSDDLGPKSDIFSHKLFDGYWSPPGFCFGTFCEDPLLVDSDAMMKNIEKRVEAFIDSALHRQGPYYTTKNIMVVMGQRFGYFDAGIWFRNIDKLISYVNAKSAASGFPVNVFYSAPACYMKAVMESNPELTVKQDDFLPFAYDQTSMAVGFFTSRPTLKFLARQGHIFMQIAKQLQVSARVLWGHDSVMERLMWVNSVIQDHNILTGVVTELGRRYYTHKMHMAIQGSTIMLNKALNKLRQSPTDTMYHRCSFNISLCQNTDAQQYFIVIYNPLAWNVTVNVRLPSLNQPFIVYHPSGLRVKASIMRIPEPVFKIYRHKTYARHELVFIAEDIPPLGFRSYFLRLKTYGWSRAKRNVKRAILKKVNKHKTKKYLVRQAYPMASDEKEDVSFDYDYFEGKTSTTPKTKILFSSVEKTGAEQMDDRDYVITPRSRVDDVITPRPRSEEIAQRRTDGNDTYVVENRPIIANEYVVRNYTADQSEDLKDIETTTQQDLEVSAEISSNETSSDSDANIAVFNDSEFVEPITTTTFKAATFETTSLKFTNDETTEGSKDIKSETKDEEKEETVKWEKIDDEKVKENEIYEESRKTGKEEIQLKKSSKEDVQSRKFGEKENEIESKKSNEEVVKPIKTSKEDTKPRKSSKEDTKSRKTSKEDNKSRKSSIEQTKSRKTSKDDLKSRKSSKEELKSRKSSKEELKSRKSSNEKFDSRKSEENFNKNIETTDKTVETSTGTVETTTQSASIEEELMNMQDKHREKGEFEESRKYGMFGSDDDWKTKQMPKDTALPEESEERGIPIDKIWDGYDYYSPDENFIKNRYITINLDSKRRLSNIVLSNGLNVTFNAEMYFYASDDPKKFNRNDRQPGVTMFRAMDPRPELIQDFFRADIYKNRLVQEIHYQFSFYASFAIRLYSRDPVIEVEWLTGPVPIGDDIGKDIIIRYTTNLNHNGVFYTDSNGRQTIKRIRHRRATYEPMSMDYLAGNIYPVTSRIYIEDEDMNIRFSVFNDRAQGATSLADGQIDMFVHRRILTDDTSRGVFILNETEYGQGIRVRGKHYLYLTKADSKPNRIFEKKLAKEKALPPQILVTKNGPYGINSRNIWRQQVNEFTALKSKLPIGVHILTFEKWGENGEDLLLRLENYLEKSDVIKSGIKRVILADLFANLKIKQVYETTLGANMWLDQAKKWNWRRKQKFLKNFNEAYGSTKRVFADDNEDNLKRVVEEGITLAPQQIRTFFITYDYEEPNSK